MPSAVDHLEAALACITREDIAALPPARRERLKATLGAWACPCDASCMVSGARRTCPLRNRTAAC